MGAFLIWIYITLIPYCRQSTRLNWFHLTMPASGSGGASGAARACRSRCQQEIKSQDNGSVGLLGGWLVGYLTALVVAPVIVGS